MAMFRYIRGDDNARFEQKVQRTESCWWWLGSRSWQGYGIFWDGTRRGLAHRWAYEREHGPIPEGLVLDHLCRNASCVNPAHMEPVTQRENVMRGRAPSAVNARKTHCLRGHPLGGPNLYTTVNGGRACRRCRKEGYPVIPGTVRLGRKVSA